MTLMRRPAAPILNFAHTIGLDGHIAFQIFAGDFSVVIRAVEPGRGVVISANALQLIGNVVAFSSVESGRAFKHHVLE